MQRSPLRRRCCRDFVRPSNHSSNHVEPQSCGMRSAMAQPTSASPPWCRRKAAICWHSSARWIPEIAIEAPESGLVTSVDGRAIGEAVVAAQSAEKSHRRAGIRLYKREGETVKKGEVLMGVFGNQAQALGERVRAAVRIGKLAPQARPVVLARLHVNPM